MKPLERITLEQRAARPGSRPVTWYRTPIAPAELKALHERSDWLGSLQTLGYLGILLATGCAAYLAAGRLPWPIVAVLVFLHGTAYAFQINAVHELGHGTVFRTKVWNRFFARVFAFLGWINTEAFHTSHAQHHRYTLHPPDDLEVVLPIRLTIRQFFRTGFIQPLGLWETVRYHWRIARGRFQGEWEQSLFPEGDLRRQAPSIRWARTLLIGHALLLALFIATGQWMLILLVTLAPFYGGALFFLCNSTQHVGLQDHTADFRLCCRTFRLNPVVRFLYWQMNYHIEHHMYAAVPCYRLGQLHRAIRHDLPPCPVGIVGVWKEIAAILRQQEKDPGFQYRPPLPQSS